jgi:hypothetical protein
MATNKDTQAQVPATLAAKILAVKCGVGAIGKDGTSQVGGKQTAAKTIRYASLPNILAAIKPLMDANHLDYEITCLLNQDTIPLLAQGIRVSSLIFVDTDSNEVSETFCYPFRLAVNPEPIKADGGTITYAQRYLLGMALGLQIEEDPDAKVNEPQPQQPAQPQQKVYTFEVCAQNLYRLHNEGNIDGAKKTYDYIVKNWGKDPAHATEIAQMQILNL